MLGSPSSSSVFSDSVVAVAPLRPRGWLSGAGALEFGLRRFAEALRLGFGEGGIEQRRQMLVERLQFRPRGFRTGLAGRFLGGGHGGNMGGTGAGGREGRPQTA